jgi:hypothetical protein
MLHIHRLDSLNPEMVPLQMGDNQWTPDRPKELITLVLRAGMFGMLKCVDGAWRELSKGHVNDVRIVKFSHPPVWSLNCVNIG